MISVIRTTTVESKKSISLSAALVAVGMSEGMAKILGDGMAPIMDHWQDHGSLSLDGGRTTISWGIQESLIDGRRRPTVTLTHTKSE